WRGWSESVIPVPRPGSGRAALRAGRRPPGSAGSAAAPAPGRALYALRGRIPDDVDGLRRRLGHLADGTAHLARGARDALRDASGDGGGEAHGLRARRGGQLGQALHRPLGHVLHVVTILPHRYRGDSLRAPLPGHPQDPPVLDRATQVPSAERMLCCGHSENRENSSMGAEGIRLYDPTAEPRAIAATLAPRLASLAGKRVGILDNGKANAGTLMLAVAKILQERYGAGEIVKRDKPVAGPPSPEALAA